MSYSRGKRRRGNDAKPALACSRTALRLRIASREKVEADSENMRDLLLPNAHFEVDQPILFELIAQTHQVVHQACDGVG